MGYTYITEVYYVQTTFLGADGASEFYFTDIRDAVAFLDKCDNGEVYSQRIKSNESLGALHGEMWGRFVSPIIGVEAKAASRSKIVPDSELRAVRAEIKATGYVPNTRGADE